MGGAEERAEANRRRARRKPADNGGGQGRKPSFLNLLSLSPSFFLHHTEAPSVHRLDAFAFVFHSVTAYIGSRL